MEENKTDGIREKKRTKIFKDTLTGMEYEYDYKKDTLTNITLKPEQIVRIRKFEVKHTYNYKFLKEIVDMSGNKITLFEVVDNDTGKKRITLKDEATGRTFPFSRSNVMDILQELFSFMSEKRKINLSEKEKWLVRILNERYAFTLMRMLLESESYSIRVREVTDEFGFGNLQKGRNVLAKFKRLGFLLSQKNPNGEMNYMPTLKREELLTFIKKMFENQE